MITKKITIAVLIATLSLVGCSLTKTDKEKAIQIFKEKSQFNLNDAKYQFESAEKLSSPSGKNVWSVVFIDTELSEEITKKYSQEKTHILDGGYGCGAAIKGTVYLDSEEVISPPCD